jgi:broad specificity phosphatase PhoE
VKPAGRNRAAALVLGACVVASGCGGAAVAPVAQAAAGPQLCVVRHAQAFRNLNPPPAGLTPDQLDALTPNGEGQAGRAGERLPPGAAAVYSSPARRTRQTATRLGRGEPFVAAELRPLEGSLSYSDRLVAWQRGDDPRPADGESLDDGLTRIRGLLARLRTEVPADAHVVLVSHGDIAPLVVGELRGTPPLARPEQEAFETAQVVCLPRPR